MKDNLRFFVVLTALVVAVTLPAHAQTPTASPQAIIAGIDARIDQVFKAEAGKPLKRERKRPPLGPGRGNYVRGYSHSMMGYAARCLYLGEQLEQANAALVENAQHYLDNPRDINDRDSFHWHADVTMRLIEMYGTNGSAHAGRITPQTETLILKPIWQYARMCSWLEKAETKQSKTWWIYSSENHHAMDFTVCWHFSKLAKDRPEYKDLQYDNGGTAGEHYKAWSRFFVAYCVERSKKSLCVEMMSDGYNATMIKALYNFYDFGNPEVRKAAGMLFDMYFAYWAQEQIDGVQGGGRSRIYFGKGLTTNRSHGMAPLAWMYFGIGQQPKLHGHDINAYLSGYRPPAVVADIATDTRGRGRYEVIQRAQGLGLQGRTNAMVTVSSKFPSKLRTDGGGILRYSYCDPAFILGTPMVEARPLTDWVHISSQNRWQGLIFSGEEDARIVPVARPADSWRALNAQWSVQSKGSLITQKLKTHKGAAEIVVWMSREGLSAPVEEDGIVFVEAGGAYAAVRLAQGAYRWQEGPFVSKTKTSDRRTRDGRVLVPDDPFAAVILEVMAKSDVADFDAFKAKVKANKPSVNKGIVIYQTIYGDRLTFDTGQKQTPTINGKPVNYAPDKVFKSPFLNADYDRGIVTISKGKREKVLDFTALRHD